MKEGHSWTTLVDHYIEYRTNLGFSLEGDKKRLYAFAKFAKREGHERLTEELARQWARSSEKQAAITWARRIDVLRGFGKYLKRFEPLTEIPARDAFGPSHRRLVPHIFTAMELQILLDAASDLSPVNGLRPVTCHTLFGLLAATGLRISEAVNLLRADVDLSRDSISRCLTVFSFVSHCEDSHNC